MRRLPGARYGAVGEDPTHCTTFQQQIIVNPRIDRAKNGEDSALSFDFSILATKCASDPAWTVAYASTTAKKGPPYGTVFCSDSARAIRVQVLLFLFLPEHLLYRGHGQEKTIRSARERNEAVAFVKFCSFLVFRINDDGPGRNMRTVLKGLF